MSLFQAPVTMLFVGNPEHAIDPHFRNGIAEADSRFSRSKVPYVSQTVLLEFPHPVIWFAVKNPLGQIVNLPVLSKN